MDSNPLQHSLMHGIKCQSDGTLRPWHLYQAIHTRSSAGYTRHVLGEKKADSHCSPARSVVAEGLLRPRCKPHHCGMEGRILCAGVEQAVDSRLLEVGWRFLWHGESDVFVFEVGFNLNGSFVVHWCFFVRWAYSEMYSNSVPSSRHLCAILLSW